MKLLIYAIAALLASACSAGGDVQELNVSAASSLTGSFTTIAREFEASHPGVKVRLNFGASSALAEQINAGAPVDVFAAASPSTMRAVVSAGSVNDPVPFTGNTLALAIPPANPANISGLGDLTQPGAKLVVCVPQAPCGKAATELFANAKLPVTPVSLEPDVKSVLAKVSTGEADAGIVYVTDVKAAGDSVSGIVIPDDVNVYSEYVIGATARQPALAAEFIAYVGSAQAQMVLTDAGFVQQ